MRVQLWSYNYDPEPTGIGPVSKVFAEHLHAAGHDVDVVAAHPHYPEPAWGNRLRPYREERGGIAVTRLPLWIGRASAAARYRQELSFTAAQTLAIAGLRRPDVRVVVSPSFPGLLPAILAARAQRIPWVLWLQDILPDGAAATELVQEGSTVLRLSRRLEAAAYASADRIAVVSHAFTSNLQAKGVDPAKIELIYNPASRVPQEVPGGAAGAEHVDGDGANGAGDAIRLLVMGNIGRSQGLAEVVEAFERQPESGATLTITGSGVEADAVRAAIRSDRVRMLGVVDSAALEHELRVATIGLVTQRPMSAEFNIPSKLMNYLAYGLPVIGMVDPRSEVARIIEDAGAGWVIDAAAPHELPALLARLQASPQEIAAKSRAAARYGAEHFSPPGFVGRWEHVLDSLTTVAQ